MANAISLLYPSYNSLLAVEEERYQKLLTQLNNPFQRDCYTSFNKILSSLCLPNDIKISVEPYNIRATCAMLQVDRFTDLYNSLLKAMKQELDRSRYPGVSCSCFMSQIRLNWTIFEYNEEDPHLTKHCTLTFVMNLPEDGCIDVKISKEKRTSEYTVYCYDLPQLPGIYEQVEEDKI